MSPRNEYTDTVRDLHSLIRKEASDQKRTALAANVDKMAAQLDRQREQLTDVKVLQERVDSLTWLVRSVIVAVLMEIIAGTAVALLVKGH